MKFFGKKASSGTEVDKKNCSRLPILIFPGFMSSALEAIESPTYSSSSKSTPFSSNTSRDASSSSTAPHNKRVWLNIQSAGFGKIYFGGALKANEEKRERGEEYDEELHQEYEQEFQCKSNWIQHMRLSEQDMVSDLSGIRVRACKGIDAVDYLIEKGIGKSASCVFGLLIPALKEVGYTEGLDLEAAPYDWRVPPSVLESRDGHFTNTILQIERIYRQNNDTPVVLLCHSMGCKTCHYFLNFAKQRKGQAWLDQYVHTYFPVGAPHIGACKSLRGTMVGDRMGLEAFLNEEESLVLARSWGSIPWMYPRMLPKGMGPIAYMRREGVLHVTVDPFDCGVHFSHRRNKPTRLKLAVSYGNEMLATNYHVTSAANNDDDKKDEFPLKFTETFTFATKPDLPKADDGALLRISLYEPGFQATNACCQSGVLSWIMGFIGSLVDVLCPIEWWQSVGLLKKNKNVTSAVEGAVLATGHAVTSVLGTASLVANSEVKDLSEVVVSAETPVECLLQLRFGDVRKLREDYRKGKGKMDIVLGETSSIPVKVRLEWKPPTHDVDTNQLSSIRVGAPTPDAPMLDISHAKSNKHVKYEAVSGVQLLRSEWVLRIKQCMQNYYVADPLGPRTLSAENAPPVKRVKAVYGINLPTEVAAVYRRRTLVQEEGKRKCLHRLDPDARLDRRHASFKITDGSIVETDQTEQVVHGQDEMTYRSGDGTVPYFSLQQCRLWNSDHCTVEIDELPLAEHLMILGDERFHKILIDYVTDRKEI